MIDQMDEVNRILENARVGVEPTPEEIELLTGLMAELITTLQPIIESLQRALIAVIDDYTGWWVNLPAPLREAVLDASGRSLGEQSDMLQAAFGIFDVTLEPRFEHAQVPLIPIHLQHLRKANGSEVP